MAVSFGDSSHHRTSSATHSYVTESTVEVQRHLSDIGSKGTSPFKMRKAKRIRFLCNGDRFYKGVVMAVAPERYRSFDSLLTDLTRAFSTNNNLPSGVRTVYTMEGNKVSDLDELEDGKLYVCSGYGEQFKKVDYVSCSNGANSYSRVKPARSLTKLPTSNYNNQGSYNSNSSNQSKSLPRPRIIILIRSGLKPRRVLRLLLNKRNAPSFEHALSTITDAVKLDTGAVRKIYNSKGTQVCLVIFFINVLWNIHLDLFIKRTDVGTHFLIDYPRERDNFFHLAPSDPFPVNFYFFPS